MLDNKYLGENADTAVYLRNFRDKSEVLFMGVLKSAYGYKSKVYTIHGAMLEGTEEYATLIENIHGWFDEREAIGLNFIDIEAGEKVNKGVYEKGYITYFIPYDIEGGIVPFELEIESVLIITGKDESSHEVNKKITDARAYQVEINTAIINRYKEEINRYKEEINKLEYETIEIGSKYWENENLIDKLTNQRRGLYEIRVAEKENRGYEDIIDGIADTIDSYHRGIEKVEAGLEILSREIVSYK